MTDETMIPAFIEVEPGQFKHVENCTADELRWAVVSMRSDATLLTQQADALERMADNKR